MAAFNKDEIFDRPQPMVDFRFDERVASVFADMIHRSIPGYATLLQLIGVQGGQCVPDNGVVYDLGCSLGGVSFALHRFIPSSAVIHALDLAPAMIERLTHYVEDAKITNIKPQVADVLLAKLEPCDLVVMNFTLQFITPDKRLVMLKKIYEALKPNGVLLLSQKIFPRDDRLRLWHESFKTAQGYSDMAVAQKRESLEAVMKTDGIDLEESRLKDVGFDDVTHYFKALSFNAWIARK